MKNNPINNKFIIKKATIKDLPDIQKLNQLLFIKEQKEYDAAYNINWPYEKDGIKYFTKELTEGSRVIFIAKDGEKPIGYLAASCKGSSKYINNMREAELENMLVLDGYRSQGIGAKLVSEFKEWAKEVNAKRVIVIASYDNEEGISFYRKQGFADFYLGLKFDL